jgi:cytochrome c553
MLIAALTAAAPSHGREKPAEPDPAALHEQLTQVSQDPAKLAAAVQRGQKDASVCRHCHGAGGNSVLPEVPNLASQNAGYLLEQMNKFVQGQRKSSAFMEGMIKALTPEERINIALFLSRQPARTTWRARTCMPSCASAATVPAAPAPTRFRAWPGSRWPIWRTR